MIIPEKFNLFLCYRSTSSASESENHMLKSIFGHDVFTTEIINNEKFNTIYMSNTYFDIKGCFEI